MKILNIGSLNIDYVYQVDRFVTAGETKSVDSLCVNCGGKGLNQSIALARAGLSTWHAGMIGPEGQFLVEELEKSGVHTELIETKSQSTGHAIIQVNPGGQNCILVYPGTNGALSGEYLERVFAHFSKGDVLLVQNETNLVSQAIDRAWTKGMEVAFNASPIHAEIGRFPLEKVRWLFINEVEGEALSGEKTPEDMLGALQEKYPKTQVVLTLGARGSLWADGRDVHRCAACTVKAVDTTGAGDTFTGFFLRGVLDPVEGISPLRLASTAGAIAVTGEGAAKAIPNIGAVLSSPLLRQCVDES